MRPPSILGSILWGGGGLLLGLLLIAGGARASGVEPLARSSLRVGSFNIAWFSGRPGLGFVPRSKRDVKRIARYLRGSHAHLLALQEVLDEEALESLTRELNRLARGKAQWDHRDQDGAVLLTPPGEREMSQRMGVIYDRKRVEILSSRVLTELSAEKGKGFLRAPLLARVKVVGKKLDFDLVNLHLKSGILAGWARERRTKEVTRLVRWIESERGDQDPDLMVLGDFNSPRDDETLRGLDELADKGQLIAIEDHLVGDQKGTHIPWEVSLDRAFQSKSLWKWSGIEKSAWIYRFDDFLPGAHVIEDFCTRGRSKVRDPERRCACAPIEEVDSEGDPLPSRSRPSSLPLTEQGEEEGEWIELCGGDQDLWKKAPEYMRISDHRPLFWDLKIPGK